jgi:hypothetical protein
MRHAAELFFTVKLFEQESCQHPALPYSGYASGEIAVPAEYV